MKLEINMKTLGQIRSEVAKEAGFNLWIEIPFDSLFKIDGILVEYEYLVDKVAKLYANAKLEEAAERLKHSDGGRYGCTYGDSEHDSISAHFGYNVAIDNAKQSILNLKGKV